MIRKTKCRKVNNIFTTCLICSGKISARIIQAKKYYFFFSFKIVWVANPQKKIQQNAYLHINVSAAV